MTGRRRHHQVTWIVAGTSILLATDVALWALWALWHLLPVLLPAAAVVLACRRWKLIRRACAWLAARREQQSAQLNELRTQVTRLETAANRPIHVIAESYERIGRQYGPAAVGRNGRQP